MAFLAVANLAQILSCGEGISFQDNASTKLQHSSQPAIQGYIFWNQQQQCACSSIVSVLDSNTLERPWSVCALLLLQCKPSP